MKKITVTLMAVLLMISMAIGVHAMESPDQNRKGTLTLVMEREGEKLNSGSLSVCQVGQIVFEDDGWKFALIPELKESDISLEDWNDPQLAKKLEQQAKEKVLPLISAPIRGGEAVFKDLTGGLYLVIQEEACEGFSPINPFLISLPRWENDRYVYDLTALPKVALEPQPTETEPTATEPTEPEPTETEPPDPGIPQTGQLNWPVPVMAVTGLTLFILGWYLCFGKKRGHES